MRAHVQTRAGRVAVERTGSGPPVLLLPSNGHERSDYDAVVPALARESTTIAVDWPGFGDSDAPGAPAAASVDLFYEVLCDVVDALALPSVALVGCSVGGTVSVRFAAERPERARGIVLVDSGGFSRVGPGGRAFCRIIGRPAVLRAIGPRFVAWYLKARNEHVDGVIARTRAKRGNPASLAVEAAVWRSFATAGNDVTAEAARVRCPVLLAWGKYDPISKIGADGARAHALFPGASLVAFETGHVPFVEDPAAFAQTVLPFLRGLAAPS